MRVVFLINKTKNINKKDVIFCLFLIKKVLIFY